MMKAVIQKVRREIRGRGGAFNVMKNAMKSALFDAVFITNISGVHLLKRVGHFTYVFQSRIISGFELLPISVIQTFIFIRTFDVKYVPKMFCNPFHKHRCVHLPTAE